MSFAANPARPKKTTAETEAAAAAKQQKADRDRIRRLLITLGDDNKKVVGQIRGLAGALEDDVELHGELMVETLLDCTKHLPLKTGIYAAWVARMAEKHTAWVASVLPRVLEELRAALRSGGATTAQLLLRLLVGMGNCGVLGLTAVLGLLQEVLALSDGMRASKGGDLGAFLALASLPFLSPGAYEKAKDKVDALIERAAPHLASRDARWKPLLRILKTDELPDRLEALAEALSSQRSAGWCSQSVPHIPGFEPSLEGRPEVPPLAPLGLTSEDIRKSKFRLQVPLVTCRLITRALEVDGADDQMSEHDRWILEDFSLLTIEQFGRDVDECAKQILRIPVLHPHFDAIAIETVFSQMLRLPSPPMLPLFYSRLLEALAEKQASTKKCIEQAYRTLIDHASDLDEESLEILAEAFAYHLMHSGYQSDWSPFTGDSVAVQAQRFLRRAFERLQRLSFHQNLLHRLPEAVHVYVPPEPLPASDLPLQGQPDFARMAGLVRIKDPNEQRVLQYCHRLLKVQAKEEEAREPGGVGDPAAAPSAQPVSSLSASEAAEGAGEPGSACEAEAEAGVPVKRRRLAAGDAPGPVLAAPATNEREPETKDGNTPAASGAEPAGSPLAGSSEADQATSSPQAPGKRRRDGGGDGPTVKQEVKHEPEDDRADGVAGVATAAEQAEKPPAGVASAAKAPKADEDELGEVPAEPWPLEAVVELFVVAALQHGAKTPTHMSKVLDGHQQVFAKLRPAEEEEAHAHAKAVARCVFQFWRSSGQRLEITVDALLHRGVLTARAVVEHALAERGPQGCDSMAVWNLINSVARKSLEHSQSVRVELAIAKKLGKADVLENRKQQLDSAIHDTAELFTLIFTGLVRNHQDFEDTDTLLRHIMVQRILTIGRKYHAFIKPLIDAAESRIPGVAHNPEIAAIFQSLGTL